MEAWPEKEDFSDVLMLDVGFQQSLVVKVTGFQGPRVLVLLRLPAGRRKCQENLSSHVAPMLCNGGR